MSKAIAFTSNRLSASNKGGLTADKDGYFCDFVIGSFDSHNNEGDFYPMDPAKALFKEGSSLMRKIKKELLKGEYGHPVRKVGESVEAYVQRSAGIDIDRVSHHFRNVKLVPAKTKAGKRIWVVTADIKPCGPKGQYVKEALENPHENCGFSIRCFNDIKWVGLTKHRLVRSIVTWDFVLETGMPEADKIHTLGLESFSEIDVQADLDWFIGQNAIERMGMESAGFDPEELIRNAGYVPTARRASMDW